MSTEGELVAMVQEWMELEKESKHLQATLRGVRAKQKAAAASLIDVMREHNIDCLDVKSGRISHKTSKCRSSVSKKHLLNAIATFFSEAQDPSISAKLTQHIMATRDVKVRDKISLRIAKKN